MNVISLMKRVKESPVNHPDFQERSATVLGILRTFDILSPKRASQNGHLHQQLSNALVLAYDNNETIDVSTRRMGNLQQFGITTRLIKWLDDLVKTGLLCGPSPDKAEGKLVIGDLLSDHLVK